MFTYLAFMHGCGVGVVESVVVFSGPTPASNFTRLAARADPHLNHERIKKKTLKKIKIAYQVIVYS